MAGVGRGWSSECGGGGVVTMREDDVSGVSYAESGEPRGYTRKLFAYTALWSLLTVVVVVLVDVAIGGVHQ